MTGVNNAGFSVTTSVHNGTQTTGNQSGQTVTPTASAPVKKPVTNSRFTIIVVVIASAIIIIPVLYFIFSKPKA